MNIIYGDRCSGKTTKLIMTSAVMNMPIICNEQNRAHYIKEKANKLRVDIPEPIVIGQGRSYKGYSYNGSVLLDDANLYIKDALGQYFGVSIGACTFNINIDSVAKSIGVDTDARKLPTL